MIADQLKKSILQVANQGKLTVQLPEDGDARDLLKEIRKKKACLIKEGKIKKGSQLPEITEDEIPFDIPENWCWIRLGDLCSKIGAGSTPSGGRATYVAYGIKFIRSQNVHNSGLRIENVSYITEDVHNQRPSSWVQSRDLLLNITGASIGRCALVPDNFDTANVNQHVLILRPIDEKIRFYIHSVVISQYIYDEIMRVQVGGTKEGLSAEKAKYLLIPFPPLAEQNRIFESLNRLLPKIDKLKNDETKLDELQKYFPKKMKDSILQYAIQGKLTEQLPEDGDAKDLLIEIRLEKARLVKEGKLRKEKPLPEITADEIPFDIPENWCWVKLGDLVLQNVGGGTPSKNNPAFWGGRIPWASVKDLNCQYLESTQDSITEIGLNNSSSNFIPKGNLIICTRMGLGKIVFNTIDVAINQDLRALFIPDIINKWYIYYFYLTLKFTGKGATVKGVSLDELLNILVPLPTGAEQNRIVEKINQLMPLCDTL